MKSTQRNIDMVGQLHFFSGSSQVGKTTTLTRLRSAIERHSSFNYIELVPLSARTVRERYDNPSWESMMNDKMLARSMQDAQVDYFLSVINDKVLELIENQSNKILVFERDPYDVVGYSWAFGTERAEHQSYRITKTLNAFPFMRQQHHHFMINSSFEYVPDEARPPEVIRNHCAAYLDSFYKENTEGVSYSNVYSIEEQDALIDKLIHLSLTGKSEEEKRLQEGRFE